MSIRNLLHILKSRLLLSLRSFRRSLHILDSSPLLGTIDLPFTLLFRSLSEAWRVCFSVAACAFGFLPVFSESLAYALRTGRVILVGLVSLTPYQVLIESPQAATLEAALLLMCGGRGGHGSAGRSFPGFCGRASGRAGTCAQSVSPYP